MLNDFEEAVQKEPEGAFAELRQAMGRIQEAQKSVSELAALLSGEEPNQQGKGVTRKLGICGGNLGELYHMASELRSVSREIIAEVDRVRRHSS